MVSAFDIVQIRGNELIYQEKPRLKTALEMLRTSLALEGTLHEVVNFFCIVSSTS